MCFRQRLWVIYYMVACTGQRMFRTTAAGKLRAVTWESVARITPDTVGLTRNWFLVIVTSNNSGDDNFSAGRTLSYHIGAMAHT